MTKSREARLSHWLCDKCHKVLFMTCSNWVVHVSNCQGKKTPEKVQNKNKKVEKKKCGRNRG